MIDDLLTRALGLLLCYFASLIGAYLMGRADGKKAGIAETESRLDAERCTARYLTGLQPGHDQPQRERSTR